MLQSDDRKILINLRFEKADENLKIARLVFDASPNKAASAAYYCVFHSMQALFLQHELSTTKKRGHRSGIDLFNRNFVHVGVFSKEIGAIAGQLEAMRNIGVYTIDREVSQDEALRAIADAEKFNAAIRTHVREQQQKESRQSTEQTQDTQEQEQIAQVNKADLNELESATALLKNQRATDNTTFKGHEITPQPQGTAAAAVHAPLSRAACQQNDTLDLLEQIKKHVQADKATMAKLESAGLSPEKDITVHKVARPGKFFSKETQGLEVVSRTHDSLMLIRGRCLFIYELKLLELQAPAQGIPGEKLDLERPKTQEKARGAQAQEQERKRTQGRGRGLSL